MHGVRQIGPSQPGIGDLIFQDLVGAISDDSWDIIVLCKFMVRTYSHPWHGILVVWVQSFKYKMLCL